MYLVLTVAVCIAALLVSFIQNSLWVYIPGILLYIRYPPADQKAVNWQEDDTNSIYNLKPSEHPNVIIILT